MTSTDDPNYPHVGFADDDDEAAGRYEPVFADDDDDDLTPAAPEPQAAGHPAEPVFAEDDDDPNPAAPEPQATEQPAEPVRADEDESPVVQAPTFADGSDSDDAQPTVLPEAPRPGESEPATEPPQRDDPPTTPSAIAEQAEPVEESEDVDGPTEPAQVDNPPTEAERPGQDERSGPADSSPTEADTLPDSAFSLDDDDPLGLGDSFYSLDSAPTDERPVPHGLPSLKGVSARQISSAEEWVGPDEAETAPATTGNLWAADDIAFAGTPTESPDFAIEPDEYADDTYTAPAAPEEQESYAEVEAPHQLESDYYVDNLAATPEPSQANYMEYSGDDYAADDVDGHDYSEYAAEDDAYGAPETYAAPEEAPVLDPDDLVSDGTHDLRERSREKKKGRRRKDKADAKLAKEGGEQPKGSLVNGKTLGIAAVVVIGGFLAVRALSGGTDSDDAKNASSDAAPKATTSQVEAPPEKPTAGEDDCMTTAEAVGTAVVCAAEGDQKTGTNAILAYEHAFYGTRDADKAYSLTWKSSEGGPEAEAAKQNLQQGINGTPCGSVYSVTVTPKEIGKLYDVTISVTSPPGDPMPSADGVCAADVEVSANPGGNTRTLIQEVAVDGSPGSFVVRSIKSKK